MTPDEYAILIAVLSFALSIAHARAEYWRARAKTIEEERNNDGWQNEAQFWRRHFNAEAAEWTTENH